MRVLSQFNIEGLFLSSVTCAVALLASAKRHQRLPRDPDGCNHGNRCGGNDGHTCAAGSRRTWRKHIIGVTHHGSIRWRSFQTYANWVVLGSSLKGAIPEGLLREGLRAHEEQTYNVMGLQPCRDCQMVLLFGSTFIELSKCPNFISTLCKKIEFWISACSWFAQSEWLEDICSCCYRGTEVGFVTERVIWKVSSFACV